MKRSYYYQAVLTLATILTISHSNITAAQENNLTKHQLIQQAELFVAKQLNPNNTKTLDVSAMTIDDRIAIPSCASSIQFSASEEALSQSNVTVKAQCLTSNWYMFMVVKAVEKQSVVVLSSAVSPGTLLTAGNVKIIKMNKKRLRTTTFADIEEVIGARIKRRVAAGRPVDPNNLCYVCKGDSVSISAGSVAMRVKTRGIALEDGNMGETIRVKNTRSNKKIHARVAGSGQVEISI
jgi:flagella basal body P-ring formation protein FlgA